jgi:abhydrolase domain-containing protein 6
MSLAIKSLPTNLYESFPYQSRLKFGERLLNIVNRAQYKKAKAVIKKSPKLSTHPGLPYFEAGDPSRPTILFIHGFGDTKESYLKQAVALKNDYHIIVPDMPGFAANPRIKEFDYNSSNVASLIDEFCERLNLTNLNLVGNSMGGAISCFLYMHNPQRINSISLLDSAGFYYNEVHSILDEFLDGKNLFLVSETKDYRNLFNRVFHKPPFIPRPVFDYLFESIKGERKWYEKMVADLIHNMETVEEGIKKDLLLNNKLKDFNVPIQLIWGEKDSLFPIETGKRIVKDAPEIILNIIKDCGHAPHYEKPKECNRHLSNFLSMHTLN